MCSNVAYWQYDIIGLINGLMPSRQQAITEFIDVNAVPGCYTFVVVYMLWAIFLHLGPLLLPWFNFDPSITKYSHAKYRVGWKYLSISKRHRMHRWSLGMGK